jgi:hypothetical protein
MAALQLLTVAVVGTVLKHLADHYKTSRNASRRPRHFASSRGWAPHPAGNSHNRALPRSSTSRPSWTLR